MAKRSRVEKLLERVEIELENKNPEEKLLERVEIELENKNPEEKQTL